MTDETPSYVLVLDEMERGMLLAIAEEGWEETDDPTALSLRDKVIALHQEGASVDEWRAWLSAGGMKRINASIASTTGRHNHRPDGTPTYPVYREACPQGCDRAPDVPSQEVPLGMDGTPRVGRVSRYDHDGMWPHHHDADTNKALWWHNASPADPDAGLAGVKQPHLHQHVGRAAPRHEDTELHRLSGCPCRFPR